MVTLNDILKPLLVISPNPIWKIMKIKEREDGSFLVDAQIPFYDFLTKFEKTRMDE